MPPRLNLSDDEMGRRVREQGRLRVKRYRERRNVTEPHKKEARNVTPSQALPVGEKTLFGGEEERVGAILAPYAPRGYKHNPRFLAKMAALYPALDLELEAMKLADWLEDDANRKAKCSSGRIHNWLEISEQRRLQGRRPINGTTNGVYHAPATRQRTPDPEGLPVLEADLQRVALPPRRAGTLQEKLAAVRGGKR